MWAALRWRGHPASGQGAWGLWRGHPGLSRMGSGDSIHCELPAGVGEEVGLPFPAWTHVWRLHSSFLCLCLHPSVPAPKLPALPCRALLPSTGLPLPAPPKRAPCRAPAPSLPLAEGGLAGREVPRPQAPHADQTASSVRVSGTLRPTSVRARPGREAPSPWGPGQLGKPRLGVRKLRPALPCRGHPPVLSGADFN